MWPCVRSGALLDQHTLAGFPALGFYLSCYVSKYHVRRDYALPGGVLFDIPIYFIIRVPNILESVFGSPNRAVNKNSCLWICILFEIISDGYSFCCVIFHIQGRCWLWVVHFFQFIPYDDTLFCIKIHWHEFSLGRQWHYIADYCGYHMQLSIVNYRLASFLFVCSEEVPAFSTARFWIKHV